MLADQLVELEVIPSISHEAVRTTLNNELRPWLKRQWCIPPRKSAAFVCQMEEVLEVYARAQDPRRPLVCLDEATKQLVRETRNPLPMAPGCPVGFDYEYERNGVGTLFMMCAPLEGWREVAVTEQKRCVDYAQCLQQLADHHFPQAERIVMVWPPARIGCKMLLIFITIPILFAHHFIPDRLLVDIHASPSMFDHEH